MTDLQRPDVSVTTGETDGTHKVDLAVSRDGKARSYTGASSTHPGAIKEVVEKLLADPVTAEWLPAKKRD
jgi:hypothetical protein